MLLIVSAVVIKFMYWVELGMQNMCFINTNKQSIYHNMQANNQLDDWELLPKLKCYLNIIIIMIIIVFTDMTMWKHNYDTKLYTTQQKYS